MALARSAAPARSAARMARDKNSDAERKDEIKEREKVGVNI